MGEGGVKNCQEKEEEEEERRRGKRQNERQKPSGALLEKKGQFSSLASISSYGTFRSHVIQPD